ncbi:MAG: TonB family protein, partial [Polyangiales bacterium]
MKGNGRRHIGAFALMALALWAAGPIYAQETGADADSDADADADAGADADADADAGAGAELHPPHLLDSPPPEFPPGREGSGLHPTVILLITITADAKVADIVVEHSASADFDAAAVEAVQTWTFEPA